MGYTFILGALLFCCLSCVPCCSSYHLWIILSFHSCCFPFLSFTFSCIRCRRLVLWCIQSSSCLLWSWKAWNQSTSISCVATVPDFKGFIIFSGCAVCLPRGCWDLYLYTVSFSFHLLLVYKPNLCGCGGHSFWGTSSAITLDLSDSSSSFVC